MVETFRQFLRRTIGWRSFGRGALAAGCLAFAAGPGGGAWWVLALTFAVLLALALTGGAEARSYRLRAGVTVAVAVAGAPPAFTIGPSALALWCLALGAVVGVIAALTRFEVPHPSIVSGIVGTILSIPLIFFIQAGLDPASPVLSPGLSLPLGVGAALALVLLTVEGLSRDAGLPPRRARVAAVLLTLLTLEVSLAVRFLPLDPIRAILPPALLFLLAREAIALGSRGKLTGEAVLRGVFVGAVGLLAVAASLSWSV